MGPETMGARPRQAVWIASQGPVSPQDNWLVALWSGVGGGDARNESRGAGLLEVPGDQAVPG